MSLAAINYVEPDLTSTPAPATKQPNGTTTSPLSAVNGEHKAEEKPLRILDKISSKIVTLGDFIDTDAVSSPEDKIKIDRKGVTRLTFSVRLS